MAMAAESLKINATSNETRVQCDRLADIVVKNFSVLLAILPVLFGVIGNSLVCLSIALEKRLHNATNYFLSSLAVVDLLVCSVLMPLTILVELYKGVWLFDLAGCVLFTTLDVFLCSGSIVHMTVIALDRYRGISQPFRARNKTMKEVVLKIVAIWVITTLITLPLTIQTVVTPWTVYEECRCGIFPNFKVPYFQIYGSTLTFIVPSGIMIVTYVKTVWLLSRQMCVATEALRRNRGSQRPTKFEDDNNSSEECDESQSQVPPMTGLFALGQMHSSVADVVASRARKSVRTDHRKLSPHRLKEVITAHHTTSMKANMRKAATRHFLQNRRDSVVFVQRERKATNVLGIVFSSFFFCWGPFFLTNLTLAICGEVCRGVPVVLASIFTWLGYISSIVNPIIYTLFNRMFRRSFWRLLTGQWSAFNDRSQRHKNTVTQSIFRPGMMNAVRCDSANGSPRRRPFSASTVRFEQDTLVIGNAQNTMVCRQSDADSEHSDEGGDSEDEPTFNNILKHRSKSCTVSGEQTSLLRDFSSDRVVITRMASLRSPVFV